ncbi:MAG: hypothetical protein Q8O03_00590 [Nanoarchaeota archaeon]|nr:hypothetical protein [Nanoarchaeota archaeon]
MKLRNLFKPKLLEARISDPSKLKEGLVYAISHDKGSSIFLYVNGQNDILLGERWHTVTSLCVHNNWLYDGGDKRDGHDFLGFVVDTITGKDVMERRDNSVYSLCSYSGILYRGSYDGVFEVFSGERIARRDGKVTALCSHEGVLYDGGYYKGVYNTFRNKPNNKKKYVTCLCSDKNSLYGVDYDSNEAFYFNSVVFDVVKGKIVKNLEELITSLSFYKGELYYVYRGWIIRLLDSDVIFCDKSDISATCSIPAELAEQIKHSHNHGFNFGDVQRINPKGFIEYLTSVSPKEERQKIVDQLFNYEKVHEDVIDWLNEHEKDIMRKAAFY